MISITVFAVIAVIMGFIVAWLLGRGRPDDAGVSNTIGSVIAGILLGVIISFVTGLTHTLCTVMLTICEKTTDMSIWSVMYPAMAIPGYWLAMYIGSAGPRPSKPTE